MSNLSPRWSAGMPDGLKEDFEADVKAARSVLQRLQEILQKDLNSLQSQYRGYEFFTKPQVQERLIHRLGQEAAIEKIIKLLEV